METVSKEKIVSLCKEHDAFTKYIEPVYTGYELNTDWHKLQLSFIVPRDANPELESEYQERRRQGRAEEKKAKNRRSIYQEKISWKNCQNKKRICIKYIDGSSLYFIEGISAMWKYMWPPFI